MFSSNFIVSNQKADVHCARCYKGGYDQLWSIKSKHWPNYIIEPSKIWIK